MNLTCDIISCAAVLCISCSDVSVVFVFGENISSVPIYVVYTLQIFDIYVWTTHLMKFLSQNFIFLVTGNLRPIWMKQTEKKFLHRIKASI